MSVERLTLPTVDGEEQWIDRQTNPSGGELRQMEREQASFQRDPKNYGLSLPLEDIWIAAFVKEWRLVTRDGVVLDNMERKRFPELPGSTLALIWDDLNAIVDAMRPNRAALQVVGTMKALTGGMKEEDRERVEYLADQFAELMGVGGPNPGSQAE